MGFVGLVFILPIAILLFSIPIGWICGKAVRKIKILTFHKEISGQTTITSEYEAPDGLCPAEIAYLYDKSFGEQELLATLFDLENRKCLQLTPSRDGNINFKITVTGDTKSSKLNDFEKEVLFTLSSYEEESSWDVLKADSAIWDSNIELKLEMELIKKGYLLMPNPKMTKIKYLSIGLIISAGVILIIKNIYGIGSDYDPTNVYSDLNRLSDNYVFIAMGVYGAVIYSLAAYYGISAYYNALDFGKGTSKLKYIWPKLEGFKEYLEVVEQDRIEFENSSLKEHARQSALPYATALNLTTRWQERFK